MTALPVASTIPACLDALVAAATAALPGAQVFDGMPVGDIADDVVCIGTTGREGEVAVQESREGPRLATSPDAESYDVACVASSWRGTETDPRPVRDAVFAMVNTLAADLARDPTLGGVVMHARLSVVTFFQDQVSGGEDGTGDGAGAVATVQFTVHVEAFTGRL